MEQIFNLTTNFLYLILDFINKRKGKVGVEKSVIDVPKQNKKDKIDQIQIKKDFSIRNKFHKGFERTLPVKYFVIHGTGGGSKVNNLLSWMRNIDPLSKRGKWYRKGIALFHYAIDRETGEIIEIMDPERWVYHASVGHIDGGTIGVELMSASRGNTAGYTDMQYKSLAGLYQHLRKQFPDMEIISTHNKMKNKFYKGGKVCPGVFDWKKFNSLLRKVYTFQVQKEWISNIKKGEYNEIT